MSESIENNIAEILDLDERILSADVCFVEGKNGFEPGIYLNGLFNCECGTEIQSEICLTKTDIAKILIYLEEVEK